MSLNDFTELMIGVTRHEEPEPEEPFEVNRRLFHQQFSHRADDTEYHNSLAVDVCSFDETGKHTHQAEKCPHYNQYDETGQRIREGWTAQQ